MICPYCKEEIKNHAVKCKYCKSKIPDESKKQSLWVSLLSLILSILCFLSIFDDIEYWDYDYYIGFLTIFLSSLMLCIITINQKLNGKNIAISSIVLLIITFILFIGAIFGI